MTAQIITAVVGIATVLLTVLYGPSWKARVDRRREQLDRSERLLARYSEPLARAAFDLQSRIYNIVRNEGFLAPRFAPDSFGVQSTLWLFGQYFAWVEVLRREVQVLDFGDVRRTANLQLHLLDIADVFASTTNIRDAVFNVRRAEQRAIGELMVVEREVASEHRSDCMGYAEFVKKLADRDFRSWFEPMFTSMQLLIQNPDGHVRPTYLQRALIDLIDFLDPDHVRFPDRNERGKLPLGSRTTTIRDRKRSRPPGQLARFRSAGVDAPAVLDSWVQAHRLVAFNTADQYVIQLPTEPIAQYVWWSVRWIAGVRSNARARRVWFVRMTLDGTWVELSLAIDIRGTAPTHVCRLSNQSRTLVNDLLVRFDRPRVPAGAL